MSSKLLIRLLVAAIMLTPALPAVTFAQNDGEVVVIEDNFDDPGAGVLQEGSDDPDLRFDYDDEGFEIDAFADDFAGDLTVPVPGSSANGTIAIDAELTGDNDSNGHYLFLACRVRDDTGYKFEIRPLAQVAAIWLLSPDGDERIANVGLEGDPVPVRSASNSSAKATSSPAASTARRSSRSPMPPTIRAALPSAPASISSAPDRFPPTSTI